MSLSNRVNFATSADIPNYPDFLDIQVKSFKDFLIAFRLIDHLYFPSTNSRFCNKNDLKNF